MGQETDQFNFRQDKYKWTRGNRNPYQLLWGLTATYGEVALARVFFRPGVVKFFRKRTRGRWVGKCALYEIVLGKG